MIWPGRAPMYVRRWPRISASSRTPPSDMRTNFRPVAFAMDIPRDVLPTPGGSRLSRHRRHGFELLQFLHGLITHVFGHARRFDFLLQLIEFALFAASEFLLNGFDLFVEVILFLGPLHLPLDPRLDGAIHVQLFNLDIENITNAAQALGRIEDFQQFLLFLD